jgi:hypothetical protein
VVEVKVQVQSQEKKRERRLWRVVQIVHAAAMPDAAIRARGWEVGS